MNNATVILLVLLSCIYGTSAHKFYNKYGRRKVYIDPPPPEVPAPPEVPTDETTITPSPIDNPAPEPPVICIDPVQPHEGKGKFGCKPVTPVPMLVPVYVAPSYYYPVYYPGFYPGYYGTPWYPPYHGGHKGYKGKKKHKY